MSPLFTMKERKIIYIKNSEKWILADLVPGHVPDLIRLFYSEKQARDWSDTYGIPMEGKTACSTAKSDPVSSPATPTKAPERDYSNNWYNNI